MMLASAGARADSVVVVADALGKQSADVAAALLARHHTVRVLGVDDAAVAASIEASIEAVKGQDVVVLALGKKSAARVDRATAMKKAALFVSDKDAPAALAAVVVDVPLSSEVAWIARALPGRSRLVVARQPRRADLDAALAAAAAAASLNLVLVDVNVPGEAVPAIDAALAKPGGKAVLLFVADDAVITADTIAPLMQSAFRARVPVVGFSSYFARVGAVAVVATDVAAMVDEALALARAPACTAPCAAPHVASASAHLSVDGRLAERLGVPVQAGDHVEVSR